MTYLEHIHGKYVADIRFGQFQTKQHRSVVVNADAMLLELEFVRSRYGKVSFYIDNPLSSVTLS